MDLHKYRQIISNEISIYNTTLKMIRPQLNKTRTGREKFPQSRNQNSPLLKYPKTYKFSSTCHVTISQSVLLLSRPKEKRFLDAAAVGRYGGGASCCDKTKFESVYNIRQCEQMKESRIDYFRLRQHLRVLKLFPFFSVEL